MNIDLTPSELTVAATIGCKRHIEALSAGLPDRNGFDPSYGDSWSNHVEGACGELAVAKALGIYWDASVGTFKSPDFAAGSLQVRTRFSHDYDLIVRRDDSDDHIFVLVTGIAPSYQVHGWIAGVDAKKPHYVGRYGGRRASYFVPKLRLNPIESLLFHEVIS